MLLPSGAAADFLTTFAVTRQLCYNSGSFHNSGMAIGGGHMYCSNCGLENLDEATYCVHCGSMFHRKELRQQAAVPFAPPNPSPRPSQSAPPARPAGHEQAAESDPHPGESVAAFAGSTAAGTMANGSTATESMDDGSMASGTMAAGSMAAGSTIGPTDEAAAGATSSADAPSLLGAFRQWMERILR
jgi:hypothetical protein